MEIDSVNANNKCQGKKQLRKLTKKIIKKKSLFRFETDGLVKLTKLSKNEIY